MKFLVGDVGGTNTRLALADASGLRLDTLIRARNDDHDSMLTVVDAYKQAVDCSDVSAVCIALAGVIHDGIGSMTNRDWRISALDIGQSVGAPRAVLINDLSALGHALPDLTTMPVCKVESPATNGQSLVVGMGTGFNVSLAKKTHDGGTVVIEAEVGHAELPASIKSMLEVELGWSAGRFRTIEDAFCGSGLERLFHATTGQTLSGEKIMAAFTDGRDTGAIRTVNLFARGLGLLARGLICQYLPRDGLVFAGSASRGILDSTALSAFSDAFLAPGMDVVLPNSIPVSLITEDAAALFGCAHMLNATS
ncbi:glucokinase [Shimia abyssi]|uniref:Glucokinase n=1 Tax=Shimia abyssi TaxID=1662395 RepID=A0A2P8F8Z3_9RHOB|nr:ROK family protein [Shimia abyssi]PSL18179.1 glucokinase [Shimia abyssi]